MSRCRVDAALSGEVAPGVSPASAAGVIIAAIDGKGGRRSWGLQGEGKV
jgi:hypothetical protein